MEEATQSSQEIRSTMLLRPGDSTSMSSKVIREALEKGDLTARAEALEAIIRLHLNGESQNHMIMTVIKYITPLDDHLVKKLVLYFWEVIDKTDKDGKLLSVIILICSFLRNDLQHPNEYVRGLTLRFLCKLDQRDMIEPLISMVVQNLTHRVTYVRRNAVLVVHSIYKKFPDLLPDAPDLVCTFIREENDVSARRNAFDMLAAFAPARAAEFLTEFREANDLPNSGGVFLLSVVDFCRQMIQANPYDKAKYVPVLFSAMQAKSPAVRFQCAVTLLGLSSSRTAIRQATLSFIDILKSHSDNSVRLIVVEQLDGMREKHLEVLQNSLLDVLSALHDGSMEIRQRIVALAMRLLSSKNVAAFLQAMRKELQRVQGETDLFDAATALEYKLRIIRAISAALMTYHKSAKAILPLLLDYVCDTTGCGVEVIGLIKDVMQSQPALRSSILEKLMELFPMINSSKVIRTVMWILSAYSEGSQAIIQTIQLLKKSMHPLPLTAPETVSQLPESARGPAQAPSEVVAVTTVREDGTYMMTYTSAAAAGGVHAEEAAEAMGLRALVVRGDGFLAATLSSTLTKLVVHLYSERTGAVDAATRVAVLSEVSGLLNDILQYTTESTFFQYDEDSQERVRLSLSILSNPSAAFLTNVMSDSERMTAGSLALWRAKDEEEDARKKKDQLLQQQLQAVDTPIMFTQLSAGGKDAVFEMEAAEDAVGAELGGGSTNPKRSLLDTTTFLKKLEETVSLSGFSDPVYCEATVTVHQFDVLVDWLLVNRTPLTLQNLTIELASLGGMKLCERPQSYTLVPHGTLHVRTSLKVSATETGTIYGNVLYDSPNGERCYVILNDIHVDIMNHITPASCTPPEFREMWSTFGWENKIRVSTNKHVLRDYIDFIVSELNMKLLEPLPDECEEMDGLPLSSADDSECCEYVSCKLYARTVFGEAALVNVSVEKDGEGLISGVVRIRANTQTIAIGIGEKLNVLQKTGKC